jgi:SAM-dependent methyltransferase
MEHKEFELMLKDEQSHWWYKARRKVVANYLNKYFQGRARAMILDIASACGANFVNYKKYGTVYGVDISEESIAFCRSKGINRIARSDVQTLPFRNGAFEIVIALDALEHFEDDIKALSEIKRVIKPGGILIITAPAMNILWSQHDRAFHHIRRYSSGELCKKLKGSGFIIEFITYRLFFLFLPVLIFRKFRDLVQLTAAKTLQRSDFHIALPSMFSTLLGYIGRLEEYVIDKKGRFPIGVSLFCAAKKEH